MILNKIRVSAIALAVATSCIFSANVYAAEANPLLAAAAEGQTPSLAPMLKNVIPAVVNISVKGKKDVAPMFNIPKEFRFMFPDLDRGTRQREFQALGSGVIIDSKKGYVVTNHHVIEDADEIRIALSDGREYDAKKIGSDPHTDLALLQLKKFDNLTAIKLADSDELEVGDFAIAIGYPLGLGQTVTSGIVSALGRTGLNIENIENFIQTDAAINSGNSGGALIDSRGAFIGMNTAIISRTGGNHGIGFAIPSEMVKNVAMELIKTGRVKRGFLGVNIKDVDSEVSGIYGDITGALIVGMQANSPAQRAGLAVWDVVTEVNGKKIKNAADLRNTIGTMSPQQKITLTIVRSVMKGGKNSTETKQISLVLAEQPQASQQSYNVEPSSVKDSGGLFDGLRVENLSKDIRQNYRIPDDINGVIVSDIARDSKASNAGFQKGDVIAQIENVQIKSIADFQNAIKTFNGKTKRILAYNVISGEVKTIIAK